MLVDKPGMDLDDVLMDLGEAVLSALGDRSQRWLADELGEDPATINRIIKGRLPSLSLALVRRMEDCLGVQPGYLLRAAGMVEELGTTRQFIENDQDLEPDDRRFFLKLYDSAVRESRSNAPASSHRQPTRRKTRKA